MENREIILDVSEFEAPLPLVKGVEAMQRLQKGETLLFIHRMFPCKLQEQIERFGLRSEILKNEENRFEMRIFH